MARKPTFEKTSFRNSRIRLEVAVVDDKQTDTPVLALLNSGCDKQGESFVHRPISASRDSARCAFTLVELLMVIAVVCILIALLIPAVQMARSAARKTQYANQLKQMAVAMADYEGVHQKLPPGFVWPDHTLWQSFILPQIEYKHLYQSLKFGMPFDNGANEAACGVQIKFFSVLPRWILNPGTLKESMDGGL